MLWGSAAVSIARLQLFLYKRSHASDRVLGLHLFEDFHRDSVNQKDSKQLVDEVIRLNLASRHKRSYPPMVSTY